MRRNIKRFFAICLIIAMLTALFIPFSANAGSYTVTAEAVYSDTDLHPGETFTVALNLSGVSATYGIGAANLYLAIDPEKIEYVSETHLAGHNESADWIIGFNGGTNKVTTSFLDYSTVNPILSNCTLAVVTFRVLSGASSGTTEITLSKGSFKDKDNISIMVALEAPTTVSINISGSAVTTPTPAPTAAPTPVPTSAPTVAPTKTPTPAPTLAPGQTPTPTPTLAPGETPAPTSETSDTSPSSSPVPTITINDENSGIKVESPIDNLPENTELDIQQVDIGLISSALKLSLEKYGVILSIYDIKLVQGGLPVEPSQMVTVSIPLSSVDKNKDYKIFRINSDETIQLIDSTLVDGIVKFETDHFSKFALISSDKPSLPVYVIVIICIAALLLIAGGVFLFLHFRKRNRSFIFR